MRVWQLSIAAVCVVVSVAVVPARPQSPASAPPDAQRIVVPLSDPARTGTVRVRLIQGSVSVKVGTSRDVVVESSGARLERPRPGRDARPTDGLRRLNQPFGASVDEDTNVVTVSTRPQDNGRLSIEVPARTNLQVSVVNGGGVVIEGVEGEIEVSNVNGPVTLTNVAGSVVAHSVNGDVVATLRQIGSSPAAFTSLNGEVDVTLPASTKATLQLRSEQGDVYTDFELQTTPAPASGRAATRPRADLDRDARRRDVAKGKYRLDVDKAVYGTINGGGTEVELRTYNGDVYLRRAK